MRSYRPLIELKSPLEESASYTSLTLNGQKEAAESKTKFRSIAEDAGHRPGNPASLFLRHGSGYVYRTSLILHRRACLLGSDCKNVHTADLPLFFAAF